MAVENFFSSSFCYFALSNFQFKIGFDSKLKSFHFIKFSKYNAPSLEHTKYSHMLCIHFNLELAAWSTVTRFYVKKSHPLCTKYAIVTRFIFAWVWIESIENELICALASTHSYCVMAVGINERAAIWWIGRDSEWLGWWTFKFDWIDEHSNQLNKAHIDSIIKTQFQLTH